MKFYLLSILFISSLLAGTYDDPYTVVKDKNASSTEDSPSMDEPFLDISRFDALTRDKYERLNEQDPFMDGAFTEIKRFDALEFKDGTLSSDSQKVFETIISAIENYIKDEKNIQIKVIGHARERTDRHNEVTATSKTYAQGIIGMFERSYTQEESKEDSESFASSIVKKLEDKNISKEQIFKEFRASNDIGFSTATKLGNKLSNRVMLTIYVLAPLDGDIDNDNILDSYDECSDTPSDVKVGENGCPFDTDRDGVVDHRDSCPDTPRGVEVDESGCPFDADKDSVLDYKDDCPETMAGLTVDIHGCPISKDLRLNFERKLSDIPEANYHLVKEFAEFLQENTAYRIQITGHTDSIGKQGDNMVLSFDRAHSVKSALIQEGVLENRIEALGRGELDPVKTNRTASGRAMNRRIEVKLFN